MIRHRSVLALALALLIGPRSAQAQIAASEFSARRDSLAARIDSGIVVAFGGRTLVHDFGTFFQLPAFRYLTDVDEPDAVLVMVVRGKRATNTLFLSPINPRTAFYYGSRADSSSSRQRFGIPGRPIAALSSTLDSLARIGLPFYTLADYESADFASSDTLTRGQAFMKSLASRHSGLVVRDAHRIVSELRARKTPAELALIRRAVEISTEGHRAAMMAPTAQHEYELRAAVEATFIRLGAERPAYGSIVGAGPNAAVLHYMKDTGPAKAGDMVVIDAGAEFRGYAADVTRSFPVNGTFTQEQKDIYQLVLDSQKAAERFSQPGMRLQAGADSSVAVRARGLAALGLIESVDATFDPPWRVDCAAQPAQCKQSVLWTIHGISHGIGLAVHDPMQPSFGDRTLKVGDAFVIEPGIYIAMRSLDALPDTPKNRAFIAKVRAAVRKYENTSVRIEDCYFITERGLERVSVGAPREIAEIEALMRRRAVQ